MLPWRRGGARGFSPVEPAIRSTIDGDADVHIAGGACITVQHVTNVIIHGNQHSRLQERKECLCEGLPSPSHYGLRTISDGDRVSIFGGNGVWVDHCSLSNCNEGLINPIHGSTAITISNNYLTHHKKVMLLEHSDTYKPDKNMQVTIAFNHFGEGLVQRMPSADPIINRQGNRFLAPNDADNKEPMEALELEIGRGSMLNGAFFTASGTGASSSYAKVSSLESEIRLSPSLRATLTTIHGQKWKINHRGKPIAPTSASTVPDVNIIGTIDDTGVSSPNAAVAAPLGSELDAKRFAPTPSDAITVGVSVIQAATAAGAVVIAGYLVFEISFA
ncbi:putative pectate lyase 5 [Hibiscus syriacus]|uniref:Pectate lyase 5 n=1 Tax=Hibiscus syriacus TaxID=106335 RepID=A0A6A3ALL5_HIBSY|nr:putative pectate lyase 5 [Hibiscus syriacus]